MRGKLAQPGHAAKPQHWRGVWGDISMELDKRACPLFKNARRVNVKNA
jgi:hypothetical protein